MNILSIETSCDETAISILKCSGDLENLEFKILGNSLMSQIDIHKEYGGVFPNLAKREHSKNLTPLLEKTLNESGVGFKEYKTEDGVLRNMESILEREKQLYEDLLTFLQKHQNKKPDIDLIVVTEGPGLAPALWVGISFAKALGSFWSIKVLGENHMKGHIASVLEIKSKDDLEKDDKSNKINFPAIALLISGGHTEIVYMESWTKYKILGQTLDDAVGEAFDKTARMLGLPYPGGPEVSKMAKIAREENIEKKIKLPRPMIKSDDLNFSFSGLKTAVLYTVEKNRLTEEFIKDICREFEDSVTEVLIHKTRKALVQSNAKTLIVGGGVISNLYIRENLEKMIKNEFPEITLKIASKNLTTDNAVMIAVAGYISFISGKTESLEIKALGNLKIDKGF